MFAFLTPRLFKDVAVGVLGFAVVHLTLDVSQWTWRKIRRNKKIPVVIDA